MMTKHKWHKEIKAWADGAEIESKWNNEKEWQIVDKTPQWFTDEGFEYRIKPQPKRFVCNCGKCNFEIKQEAKEPQYLKVYGWLENQNITFSPIADFPYIGKIKLEQVNE